MEAKKSKSSHGSEKSGMTRSHSSTSSLSSIPRLPPIESESAKAIAEVPADEMQSKLNRLLEIGKSDIMLTAISVVEQARSAESQLSSRMESLSHEIQNAVAKVVRARESEMLELRARSEDAENRAASLLERERGLVEQQSQLSIELVLERRGKQAAEAELCSLKEMVEELKVKLEDLLSREKEKKESELKTKNDWSTKVKESKEEISNLKRELEDERELRKKESDSSKMESNDKHSKESMRLHQEVNKWRLKCEKLSDEIESIKKGDGIREEELKREKVSNEEKSKHESSQHKSALKALQAKMEDVYVTREAEINSRNGIIEKTQKDIDTLKKKYNDALQQIEMLKRTIEEYENPVDSSMENSRLRLLRAQNQREKAKLDYDRREAIRLNCSASNK